MGFIGTATVHIYSTNSTVSIQTFKKVLRDNPSNTANIVTTEIHFVNVQREKDIILDSILY